MKNEKIAFFLVPFDMTKNGTPLEYHGIYWKVDKRRLFWKREGHLMTSNKMAFSLADELEFKIIEKPEYIRLIAPNGKAAFEFLRLMKKYADYNQ